MIGSLEKLATAWIALNSRPNPLELDTDEPNQWAHDKLSDLSRDDPDACWEAIIYIMKRAPDDYILGSLAAGPLEDLLVYHGEEMIDQVEREAQSSRQFKKALAGVWKNNISEEVWRRVEVARDRK